MIPSCLYFLFKRRVELEFLKESFMKKKNDEPVGEPRDRSTRPKEVV